MTHLHVGARPFDQILLVKRRDLLSEAFDGYAAVAIRIKAFHHVCREIALTKERRADTHVKRAARLSTWTRHVDGGTWMGHVDWARGRGT